MYCSGETLQDNISLWTTDEISANSSSGQTMFVLEKWVSTINWIRIQTKDFSTIGYLKLKLWKSRWKNRLCFENDRPDIPLVQKTQREQKTDCERMRTFDETFICLNCELCTQITMSSPSWQRLLIWSQLLMILSN